MRSNFRANERNDARINCRVQPKVKILNTSL